MRIFLYAVYIYINIYIRSIAILTHDYYDKYLKLWNCLIPAASNIVAKFSLASLPLISNSNAFKDNPLLPPPGSVSRGRAARWLVRPTQAPPGLRQVADAALAHTPREHLQGRLRQTPLWRHHWSVFAYPKSGLTCQLINRNYHNLSCFDSL